MFGTQEKMYVTGAHAQSDPSQEVIAGQRLPVPHGQLQADILQILGTHAFVDEGVIVVRVQSLLYHRGLPLSHLGLHWQQIPTGGKKNVKE